MKYLLVPTLLASTALAGLNVVDKKTNEKPVVPRIPTDEEANSVEHPAFQPFDATQLTHAALFEQFDKPASEIFETWKVSNAMKKITDEKEEFSFTGRWAIEEPYVLPGLAGDAGLVLKSEAQHHAISKRFDQPLDNTGKTLVLQYEVKLQNGLTCGGAYVKLLSDNAALATDEFNNDTPYQVMFGPDKCGNNDKTHFIIRRKSPVSGEYEEKHLVIPPRSQTGKLTNLYTLIIHENQDYEIRINGEVRKAGTMLYEDAFKPALNPPKEISDVNDVKPESWVDEKMIPDPNFATKPEDWNEDAPMRIADPEARMPEDWREDLLETIADPEAFKPEEWDDEEDGEWIAAEIPNPACESISGCGPWEAPLIKNPEYKGKWSQPLTENPEYKGEWEPRMIANPDYYEDSRPSDLEAIGGIGFELWTMQADILFDNIYVGQSVEEAELIGNATYVVKAKIESEEYNAMLPISDEPEEEKSMLQETLAWFMEDPIGMIQGAYEVFIPHFRSNPIEALTLQPVAGSIVASTFIMVSMLLFGFINVLWSFFTKKQIPPVEKKKAEARAKAASVEVTKDSASTSALETETAEVRKRS